MELSQQAERFVETYGGRHFDVPGGLLEGALTLAARDPLGLIRRTTDGASAFVAADHDTAQCAFFISETGAFGSSWSGEFGLLFDSIEHVIESLACWERMRGWIYVSNFSGTPDDVVSAITDLPQEISLGSTSRWWFGPSTAVVVEPRLSPTTSPAPQVTVLARDVRTADHLLTTLAPIPAFTSGLVAARLSGRVGADD